MYNGDERLNEDALVYSGAYQRTMEEKILPYLEAIRQDTVVKGEGSHPLFCSRFDAAAPKGSIVLLHGFSESAEKFSELIYSLLYNGFSVCAYDQRGHGRSWREEGLADGSVTHVGAFDEYIRDLECVMDQVVKHMPGPRFLFGHSMGGAVAALYLEGHQGVFQRAVLSSPMIACSRGGLPLSLSKLVCRFPCALGKGKARSFFSRPYEGPEDFDTSCATGRERFDWYDHIRVSKKEFQNCGPTYRWTLEALRVTGRLLAPGCVEKVDTPLLLFTAENDNMVLPEAQQAFAGRLKNGEQRLVKDAKHEIYRSADDVLFPWWHEVLAFLSAGAAEADRRQNG